jgi:hypothetical protein
MSRSLGALGHISLPGQTSEFEFRLVKPTEGNSGYPISGRYQGWFYLKTLKGQVKIEDKEINIRFIVVVGEEGHKVEGEGSNKFGKFQVYGSLSDNGYLQMYREYILKESIPLKRKSIPSVAVPKANIMTGISREAAQRVRKTNNLGSSFVSGDRVQLPKASVPAPPVSTDNVSRTPRLGQHMVRCGELLKDLVKQPQAIWFGQPVDYIILKIPDYPTIIKEPMDFGTIQRNLDNHFYASPDAFAEHVRLVFRNAVTYNTMRDNPVHISARELSNRFEERYLGLISQLTAAGYGLSAPADGGINRTSSISGGLKKLKSKHSLKRSSSYGPGQMGAPLVVDGGFLQLQKQMAEMQNEISMLRAKLKQSEVKSELELHV